MLQYKILFEDNKNSLISQLYKCVYKDTSCFVYTCGNTRFMRILKDLISADPNDIFIVFIDMAPDNRDIKDRYEEIKSLSAKNDYRVIILPCLPAEYHLLKSCNRSLWFYKDHFLIDTCLFNSAKLTDTDILVQSNFENACKEFLRKSDPCISTDSRNAEYGNYYTKDCDCDKLCGTLRERSLSLIRTYKVYKESDGLTGDSATIDSLWDLHRELVDSMNKWFLMYKETRGVDYHSYKLTYIKS